MIEIEAEREECTEATELHAEYFSYYSDELMEGFLEASKEANQNRLTAERIELLRAALEGAMTVVDNAEEELVEE